MLPTVACPDDDPFLWLEDIDGARALAWVAEQTAKTAAAYGGATVDADRERLRAVLDRPARIPFVMRRGGLLYNFWRDEVNARGLWRRTSLEQFRTETPSWEVLLDLDALAAAEGEDWVWGGAVTLPPAHERAMVRLSRGGGDAVLLREFDLSARAFVAGGFALAEAKGAADWLDADTLLLASAYGPPEMRTRSGYARTVRVWRRGTAVEDAETVFSVDEASLGAGASVDRSRDGRVVFVDQAGFFDEVVWLGDREGPKVRLEMPTDARPGVSGDWLVAQPRTDWVVGETRWAADTLLGFGLDAFLAGERRASVLFEPGERVAMEGSFFAGGKLVVSVLDDLRPRFEVLTPGAPEWETRRLAGVPKDGVASVGRLDVEEEESDGTLVVSADDPVTPPALLLAERFGAPSVLKRASAGFDASGLVVTRHEAVSVDGERIPYTQTGPAGEPTGDAPVHLTGYGGFQVSMLPHYDTRIGLLWLERGGTRVVANIRGGGEFGTRWHEAGRGRFKARSHDDFACVAADLVRRGVTRPERIAAEGGSNGGLLIANMLTRYPERFGALFCTIPLVDMRRYTKLLAGASWIAEYGDPERDEDWGWLREVSAYHGAVPGRAYPPILIATTRRDDRVHPGHARKFAAKLQAMGYRAFFHEPEAGGHGYGKDNAEVAAFSALGAAFLRRGVGWDE